MAILKKTTKAQAQKQILVCKLIFHFSRGIRLPIKDIEHLLFGSIFFFLNLQLNPMGSQMAYDLANFLVNPLSYDKPLWVWTLQEVKALLNFAPGNTCLLDRFKAEGHWSHI